MELYVISDCADTSHYTGITLASGIKLEIHEDEDLTIVDGRNRHNISLNKDTGDLMVNGLQAPWIPGTDIINERQSLENEVRTLRYRVEHFRDEEKFRDRHGSVSSRCIGDARNAACHFLLTHGYRVLKPEGAEVLLKDFTKP